MLGQKQRLFKTHIALSLDDLVPANHFYRGVEAKLDLSFVRDLVKGCYSLIGRPSIDPIVFFKLQLIMFFEGIRSERQLMETVEVNLAHRWYIGYDLDEPVPDHSALSKIRDRYGLDIFQQFFEVIVERCIAAGLVWGKELYFDGTKVRANADIDKQVPRFYWEARQHLQALFAQAQSSEPTKPTAQETSRGLVSKYNGQRLLGVSTSALYERQADLRVCPTDPDATPLPSHQGKSRLGYHVHYVVDGGKGRIVLGVLTTPASIQDNTPMLDLERWVRFRWKLHPRIAVADARYSTLPNIVGLEQDGIRAYLAIIDHSKRTKLYSPERFQYSAQDNCYICPQGQTLRFSTVDQRDQAWVYRAPAKICKVCSVKHECTTSTYGRVIKRSFFQEYLDRARAYQTTAAYQKAMRKRAVWIEPLFGEAKQWHQMLQFRWRRLRKVNIQALLTAAGQNIKRLLRAWRYPSPLPPASALALVLPSGEPMILSFSLLHSTQDISFDHTLVYPAASIR
jgi:transposase